MKLYQHQVDLFADYLNENGLNKITMEEAKEHIQDYLAFLHTDKKLSATSIHTACASLCKVFHTTMWDYDKAQRSIAKITRGNQTFKGKNVDIIEELQ